MKINIYSRKIEYPEEYMTRRLNIVLFFVCEVLLEGFSRKVFNETTCAIIQLTNVMYSFLQEPFFPTEFSDGVFNEACAYHSNRTRGVL